MESHVRFGGKVYSPLVCRGKADFLVCFHADEQLRLKPFLKQGGKDLTVYLDKAEKATANPRHLNTFLLGVLSAHLTIKEKNWTMALSRVFSKKTVEQNLKVFFDGRSIGLK